MSVADYPDFQRLDSWVGAPLVQGVQGAAMPHAFGPFFVAAWESIAFDVFQANGAQTVLTLTIDWRDIAGGPILESIVYTMRANGRIADVTPVQAAFVTFTLSSGSGAVGYNVLVIPRRGFNLVALPQGLAPILTFGATNIAAGASQLFQANRTQTGRAVLAVFSFATDWVATLQDVDIGGTITGVVGVTGSLAGRSAAPVGVELPTQQVALNVTNNDAAVKQFFGSLIPSQH